MGYEVFIPVTFFIVAGMVLAPFARAYARRLENGGKSQQIPPDVKDRLERMEHAIDSIAVEVERISEGQRFTTRLLAERTPADQTAGIREPRP